MRLFFLATMLVSQAAAASNPFPLFRAYPSLERAFPRVEFLKEYTPLEPMAELQRQLFANHGYSNPNRPLLWVKRDDMSEHMLGGNKARKLEFIMADAVNSGRSTLITSGMYGSNHCLATAEAASIYGKRLKLILGPQPVTDNVRQKLLAYKALGAELRYHPNIVSMGGDMLMAMVEGLFSSKVKVIPPGGSDNEGDIGYVNAFFEFLEQNGSKNMPWRIYAPVGTGGTVTGLMVGACLSGMWERVQFVGIGVVASYLIGEATVRGDARSLYRHLVEHMSAEDRKRAPRCDFSSHRGFLYTHKYYEPGYGAHYPQVDEVIDLVKDAENVILDATYSAKAMQAYLDTADRFLKNGWEMPKMVFWQTYNSYDLNNIIKAHAWTNPRKPWRDLPEDFWGFYEKR